VRQAAAQASAALAHSGAVGCYVVGPRGRISDPLLLDDAVLEQIESGKLFRAEHGVAGSDRLYLTQPDVAQRKQEAYWRLQRDLTRLAHRSRVASDGGHASIRVRLARGHAAEDQWLNVIRSRPSSTRWGHSRQEFIAEMTEGSQLWPHLKRGERLIVGLHEPLEVLPASSSASLGK
jgi:hypothetical protein